MTNFNTVNKANTAQSLLPAFSETTDISGESFQSIFESVKDDSLNPYSRKENRSLSYQANNSYSSYSDTKKYSDRISENKYGKNDKDYNKNDAKYNKDKENYEAVERKVYRDDSLAGRNMKNSNTIKGQSVFEKKDVKVMKNNQVRTGSNKEIISNLEIQSKQNTLSNQNTQLENSQADAVSIKDILALLQTAAKNNTNIEAANDEEETALENISIDAGVLLQNIETAIHKLNVSDDLKMQLQNIILSFENIEQSDLQDIVKYISVLSDDINIADINAENISLEEISEKILGTEVDNSSLEKAYTAIQEKISDFSNKSKDNAEVKIENTEELTPLVDDKTILIDDRSNNTKIINNNAVISNVEIISNLSALIDEAVKEADLPSNNDKLELAKDIVSAVKAAAENILYKSNDVSSGNMLENTTNAKDTIVMNTDISYEDVKQTAQLLENNTESKQPLLKIDNLAESSSEDIAESNNNMQKLFETTEATDTADTVAENINSKQSNEKLSQVTVKEAVKETVKESVKDTIKQSDTVSVKDIQKEFKTASVESAESLRGESNAKAEIKARTVNLTETGKNLQNNLNQKEVVMAQSNAGAGENFSVSQSDKGNNFNYFLKSSTDAQAKYDTAQSKEAQAPYNMKEPRDIERLVRTMQSSVSKNQSKLTVILTPENLGKMQIQLSESGGKITAKFLLDNENSHKLIMAQSDLLKNQLAEKGIVVDNMEFAHNDAMSKQQHNDEQGRRTSKHAQKGKGVRNQENDLEVGTEVANKKATGIYA